MDDPALNTQPKLDSLRNVAVESTAVTYDLLMCFMVERGLL